MSGFLFLIVIAWIKRTTGTELYGRLLQSLRTLNDFSDDKVLLSGGLDHAQDKLSRLYQFGRNVGLKINTEKTKVLRLNTARPDPL